MSLHAWVDYNHGSRSRIDGEALSLQPDPLATTIRMALDARKLGLSAERTEELMLQTGFGIDVVEFATPTDAQHHIASRCANRLCDPSLTGADTPTAAGLRTAAFLPGAA